MHDSLVLSISTLLGFLLTLVRISGVFVFIPIPGVNSVLAPVRVILVLGITMALFPVWPAIHSNMAAGEFAKWILIEAVLGVGIGLAVAFLTEAFAVGAQMVSLQAGYSFASTIDPNTQADSTVLVTLSQLVVGLLFFTMGIDRQLISIFAGSIAAYPPGTVSLPRAAGLQAVMAGSAMFSTGFRIALPLIVVMMMLDISLALLGRVNAQLHLVTIAFPVKMAAGLILTTWIMLAYPALMRGGIKIAFSIIQTLFTY